ncbi:MAG: ImmA/IrrE family metallo-endopeptidase [Planctomycetota bacterium]|nr:ImmA/IrrE family metallo-endopeptidase [Planctomycetota bacterium]
MSQLSLDDTRRSMILPKLPVNARQGNHRAGKSIIANWRGSTRIEWEANWFAAGLLMPAAVFSEAMAEKGRDNLRALAHRFNVSIVAAEFRRDTVDSR